MIECTLSKHSQLIDQFVMNMKQLKSNPRIIQCISKLLCKEDDYKFLIKKYEEDIDIIHALKQQRSLGTSLLHHGKIEKGCSYAQETYNLYQISPINIQNWTTQLVNQLLNLSIKIWKTRNSINNQENKDIPANIIQRINSQIIHLYSKHQNKVDKSEEYLFKHSIKDLLNSPIKIRNKWLHSLQQSISIHQSNKKQDHLSQSKITCYFHYILS